MTGSRPMTGDLIERLEKAEAGSLAIDKAILADLGFTWRGMAYWNASDVMWNGSVNLSRSLDAAIELSERLLPGAEWKVTKNGFGVIAEVSPYEPDTRTEAQKRGFDMTPFVVKTPPYGSAPTPALALCIAILKARTAASSSSVGTDGEAGSEQQNPLQEGVKP